MLQLMRCELSKQEKNQCLVFATLEEEVKSLAALGGGVGEIRSLRLFFTGKTKPSLIALLPSLLTQGTGAYLSIAHLFGVAIL